MRRAKPATEMDPRRPGGRRTQSDISGFSGFVLMEVWNTDKLQVLTRRRVSNGARFKLLPSVRAARVRESVRVDDVSLNESCFVGAGTLGNWTL